MIQHFLQAVLELSIEIAPYLFLGFLISGILYVFLPVSLISKHLGSESASSIIKASLFGVPLPVCSCGVLPIAASLRKSGASKSATLSFLITTPVTGIDSIFATYALLGGFLTWLRVAISVMIGLSAGFIQKLSKKRITQESAPAIAAHESKITSTTPGTRFKAALSYGFWELPRTMAHSLFLGLLIGGLISAVFPSFVSFINLENSFISISLAIAMAVPLYVCATGSVPVAASMLSVGFSPGAALAFLIAGPATNAIAISTVRSILGTKPLVIYLTTIIAGSFLFGVALDNLPITIQASQMHHQQYSIPMTVLGVGFIVYLVLLSILESKTLQRLFRKKSNITFTSGVPMKLEIPSMSCQHCVATIENTISKFETVQQFEVNLLDKSVVLDNQDKKTISEITEALDQAGYSVTSIT